MTGRHGWKKPFAKMVEASKAAYIERIKERLRPGAQELSAKYGIPVAELMKYGWTCERRGYLRGFSAAWMQQRRKRLA